MAAPLVLAESFLRAAPAPEPAAAQPVPPADANTDFKMDEIATSSCGDTERVISVTVAPATGGVRSQGQLPAYVDFGRTSTRPTRTFRLHPRRQSEASRSAGEKRVRET